MAVLPHRRPLPFVLEDRTGLVASSDFDDIYDRLFLRVAEQPHQARIPAGERVVLVFDMPARWSRRTERAHYQREPSAILHFGPQEALGRVEFAMPHLRGTMPMTKYLQKTSMFGGSLSRQFVAADGRRYRWTFSNAGEHEWACTSADDGFLVAHYNLRPPGQAMRDKSGNVLTIQEEFAPLAVELVCSLQIMRHIQQHHL